MTKIQIQAQLNLIMNTGSGTQNVQTISSNSIIGNNIL
jgi:hypothetical protein